MNKIFIVLASLIILSGCSSLKINVDYDAKFDFSSVKTFAVVHHNKEGENTLFNDRVIQALEVELSMKAYEKSTQEKANLVFVFHADAESQVDIDTDYTMVGYRGYGYGGHMIATTRTYKYTKGTLIIDALNPKDKKIVWRGIATDILKTYDNPDERTKYINKVVKEIMKDFPSELVLR